MKYKRKNGGKSYAYLPYTVELRVMTLDKMTDKVLGLVCLDKDGTEECIIVGDKQFYKDLSDMLRDHADDLDEYNGRPA